MVAYSRFYPTGYVGLEQATILLARRRYPTAWDSLTMLPGEEAVWRQFGVSLNAQMVDYCLFTELNIPMKQMPAPTFDRYLSFIDAQIELRQHLFSGSIIGEFVDEYGKWGYLFPEGWGGDEVDIILGRGIAVVSEGAFGSVTRLVLLNDKRLNDLICDPSIKGPPPCRGMDADSVAMGRHARTQEVPTQDSCGGHLATEPLVLRAPGKRGPKEKYNWPAFEHELHRKVEHDGGIAPDIDPGPAGLKQSDLEEYMRGWCFQKWGVEPGESTIRAKVSKVLRALNEASN